MNKWAQTVANVIKLLFLTFAVVIGVGIVIMKLPLWTMEVTVDNCRTFAPGPFREFEQVQKCRSGVQGLGVVMPLPGTDRLLQIIGKPKKEICEGFLSLPSNSILESVPPKEACDILKPNEWKERDCPRFIKSKSHCYECTAGLSTGSLCPRFVAFSNDCQKENNIDFACDEADKFKDFHWESYIPND